MATLHHQHKNNAAVTWKNSEHTKFLETLFKLNCRFTLMLTNTQEKWKTFLLWSICFPPLLIIVCSSRISATTTAEHLKLKWEDTIDFENWMDVCYFDLHQMRGKSEKTRGRARGILQYSKRFSVSILQLVHPFLYGWIMVTNWSIGSKRIWLGWSRSGSLHASKY